MGIEKLLNFCQPALIASSIIEFRGQTAAVDAMAWLYKGCYSCAYELNNNIQTSDYLYFVQKMIMMLREYDITPILVFDGRKLKAKDSTEQQRKKLKMENLVKAQQLQQDGEAAESKKYFQRCLKITKQMLYTTLDVLKEMNVKTILAPYESDAQLAHLVISGVCDFAITEDSDLICYQCPTIVFKLQQDGSCQKLPLKELRSDMVNRAHLPEELRVFLGLENNQLIDTCILSGCDYVPSIKGIGIRKAVELVYSLRELTHVAQRLKRTKGSLVPDKYAELVERIRLIFKFQIIYDTKEKKQMQLNYPQFKIFLEENAKSEKPLTAQQIEHLIGETIDSSKQTLFSQGDLDVKTLLPRERPKIDYHKLFKKLQKNASYQKQGIIDLTQQHYSQLQRLQVKDLIQPYVPDPDLPDIEHEVRLVPKVVKIRQPIEDIDVFKVCEQIFQNEEILPNALDQQPTQVQQQQPPQEVQSEESHSEPLFNPFATQIKPVIGSISDLKEGDLINRFSTTPRTPTKSEMQKSPFKPEFKTPPQNKPMRASNIESHINKTQRTLFRYMDKS